MVSLYDPNVPTGLVDLDTDYKNLQNNFAQADTTFGIDHYKFSNQDINENGFHNKVTTPLIIGGVHPTTAAAIPVFYAMKDGTNGQTIQYSRGGSDAVPSPVTFIQSPVAAINLLNGGITNIYDFAGTTLAIAEFWLICTGSFIAGSNYSISVFWDGANFLFVPNLGAPGIYLQSTGSVLQLINQTGAARNGIRWTLKLNRIET